MPPDAKYTRQYCICRNFATDGVCNRGACQYSHTLLDTARIAALVGELPPSSADEKVHFLVEYTKYSTILDGADPDEHKWRMRLLAGGRATLCEAGLGTDGLGGSVSVQPVYPVKGQGREAGVAIDALERRVFGRSYPPDPARRTLCKLHVAGTCRLGRGCRYSHTLFDMHRIDALLDEAVGERGYRDYRPLVEAEYVRATGTNGDAGAMLWRVTLRCIVGGYQQKASPQPVVVTAQDLNTAFRLLEGQFAASAGKPQPATSGAQAYSSHHRSSTAPPRPARGHARQRSAPNATNRPTPQQASSAPPEAQPSFSGSPNVHDPPPSYNDAMRGNYTPSHNAKRAL
ncbi:uncharacterized protein PHACADRAFT_248358 [Phanerochaete carnosa HHB-10118-sp]|uniref:C3H1-type domain-containing protein n=1 Tax=Phanerochaete carnosa (strain HHB-10118-sp) TaxID=650164 RepID=K5XEX3_PHACS|nr:uncharacterized protein PHACADRAFT_248358 [Phanerochaete carnosa HHB-10118-sp]EKM61637.1 hypothetical protein PHACADRAFT_248358 [Phanerochaete carnosa HHB-10118-sp]